ncbi:cytochrome P450 93B2-like [Lycium barbarum]|uniref:cytochrome P450 93B2-like n=1 Tax=Lycium barbarum TaxID=112863 RepID=UPI00293E5077|nr:cytochrome P450 93B2-like [Lycium barbarum]
MPLPTIFSFAILLFLSIVILRPIFSKLLSKSTHNHGHCPPSPLALPVIGHLHLLSPNIHRSFHKLYCRYGPLYQLYIGRQLCFVASTPQLAKEFLKNNELVFSSRECSPAVTLLTYDVSLAFSPVGSYWKFIKKLCTSELLSTHNLNNFRPLRAIEVRRFVQTLMNNAENGDTVNLTKELLKLTSNIISRMMMSSRCSDNAKEAEEVIQVVTEVTEIFGTFDVADVIGFGGRFDFQGIKKRARNTHRKYDALLEKFITGRKMLRNSRKVEELKDDGKDLLDLLLDIMESETSDVKITEDHIKALILDFLTAATDTTAITVEWAIAELTNNPRVLKKAQQEIDKVVGKQRIVGELDGPNLPYIQAIINETFRLHPPIPLLIRKSVEDCNVEGYQIPNGSLLFVNIWSIGRNPKYWENPMEFRPERFMEPIKGGAIDAKGHCFELLPFGTERRGCPGSPLALRELHVVLSTMIQCFEWKALDSSGEVIVNGVDVTERPGLTAPRINNMTCLLQPRVDLSHMIHESSSLN